MENVKKQHVKILQQHGCNNKHIVSLAAQKNDFILQLLLEPVLSLSLCFFSIRSSICTFTQAHNVSTFATTAQ